MKSVTIIALALLAGLTGAASAAEWTTTYGTMQLPDAPRYGAVRAPYASDEGRIVGTMQIPKCLGCGPEIVGVWVERGSARTCESPRDGSLHWGNVTLTFNPEYTAFEGAWDYCGDGATNGWRGTLGASRAGFSDR